MGGVVTAITLFIQYDVYTQNGEPDKSLLSVLKESLPYVIVLLLVFAAWYYGIFVGGALYNFFLGVAGWEHTQLLLIVYLLCFIGYVVLYNIYFQTSDPDMQKCINL